MRSFAILSRNGNFKMTHDRGALFIRLPTPDEAELIRRDVGAAMSASPRRKVSDEVLARKREAALMARQKIAQKTGLGRRDRYPRSPKRLKPGTSTEFPLSPARDANQIRLTSGLSPPPIARRPRARDT